jgi:hypothetical protein
VADLGLKYGYYWDRWARARDDAWDIAAYDQYGWHAIGHESAAKLSDFAEIGEEIIRD